MCIRPPISGLCNEIVKYLWIPTERDLYSRLAWLCRGAWRIGLSWPCWSWHWDTWSPRPDIHRQRQCKGSTPPLLSWKQKINNHNQQLNQMVVNKATLITVRPISLPPPLDKPPRLLRRPSPTASLTPPCITGH